jgi:uncharacterized membrane protein YphA (DoxX/SURF4 family)
MMTMPQITTSPKWMVWTGRVISVLPVLMLIMSGVMKFNLPDEAVQQMKQHNWDPKIVPALAIVELGSTLLYIIPQTAMLGAILLTGYLGGAVCSHVNYAEYTHMLIPLGLGVLVWLGLYFRDYRVRSLVPLRSLDN